MRQDDDWADDVNAEQRAELIAEHRRRYKPQAPNLGHRISRGARQQPLPVAASAMEPHHARAGNGAWHRDAPPPAPRPQPPPSPPLAALGVDQDSEPLPAPPPERRKKVSLFKRLWGKCEGVDRFGCPWGSSGRPAAFEIGLCTSSLLAAGLGHRGYGILGAIHLSWTNPGNEIPPPSPPPREASRDRALAGPAPAIAAAEAQTPRTHSPAGAADTAGGACAGAASLAAGAAGGNGDGERALPPLSGSS
jgi:hypothetical protein